MYLKEHLISVITQVDNSVSVILSDVVEMIARDSFDVNWENMLP